MPDRQIPWKRLAEKLGGTMRVSTGVNRSRFTLAATVAGIRIDAVGTSMPYGLRNGTTEIRAKTPKALGANIFLAPARNGEVPMWRRFAMRDVVIGDARFDTAWIINARREAEAQAFLDAKTRASLEAVPAAEYRETFNGMRGGERYSFALRGRIVRAKAASFETSETRFAAAIEAAVALAKQPFHLFDEWKTLAAQLGGRLESDGRWAMDGGMRVQFPARGQRITATPRVIRLGYRRDRLRTRVYCECASSSAGKQFRVMSGESSQAFGDMTNSISSAMIDSGALALESDGKRVFAEFDGNVTDAKRITAAANAVAILAGDSSAAGPYR
tara:strand:- start:124206 stop:125195 length:990 start_codon:yes stop_codon:yes gene_type:complete